jgi:hypothetical protein
VNEHGWILEVANAPKEGERRVGFRLRSVALEFAHHSLIVMGAKPNETAWLDLLESMIWGQNVGLPTNELRYLPNANVRSPRGTDDMRWWRWIAPRYDESKELIGYVAILPHGDDSDASSSVYEGDLNDIAGVIEWAFEFYGVPCKVVRV